MLLGRWQKLGVVLSIIWLIGAAAYVRHFDVGEAQRSADSAYHICTMAITPHWVPNLAKCAAQKAAVHSSFMERSWGNVAIAALAPLPIWWIFGTILFYFIKAQVIGLRAAVPVRTMTPLKKAFFYLCCFSTAAFLYFSLLLALNLYTDAKVPVALSPTKTFYVNSTGDWVTVSGTWVESGHQNEPIQTSNISCRKEEHKCIEGRATVSGGDLSTGLLTSDLNEYPIESWSDASIVFTDVGFCTSTIYTIDLKTEAVSGAGHLVDPAPPTCVEQTGWNYQLVAGFPVYWAKRQTTRPYLLRLMQAVFGA